MKCHAECFPGHHSKLIRLEYRAFGSGILNFPTKTWNNLNYFFVLEYNYSPAYPSMQADSAVLNFVKLCDFFWCDRLDTLVCNIGVNVSKLYYHRENTTSRPEWNVKWISFLYSKVIPIWAFQWLAEQTCEEEKFSWISPHANLFGTVTFGKQVLQFLVVIFDDMNTQTLRG